MRECLGGIYEFLADKLHTYLADLNKRAQSRSWCLVHQMAENESVAEDLKRQSQWEWVKVMNSIVNRAEKIIRSKISNT